HLLEQLRHVVDADGGALQHAHRGAAVRHPDHEHAHGSSPPVPFTLCPLTAAAAVDSRCRRATWKARICSSTARSTLRTSTSSGTCSTTGAKFRMLRTPAETSWS